jgi:hypothetical protein
MLHYSSFQHKGLFWRNFQNFHTSFLIFFLRSNLKISNLMPSLKILIHYSSIKFHHMLILRHYFYIFFYWHNNFIIWMSHHGIISFKVEKINWTICSWGLKQSYMWFTCLEEVNYLPSCHLEKKCFHFGLCASCEFVLKTKTWFPSDFCINVWQRLLEMVEPMEMVECITWHYY